MALSLSILLLGCVAAAVHGEADLPHHAVTVHPAPVHAVVPHHPTPAYGHPTPTPAYGHPTPAYGHPTPSYGHPTPAYGHPAPAHGHAKPGYCDPAARPACAYNTTANFCLSDYEYPEYEIKAAITSDPIFAKKYSDVATQSADDLVDYVTKEQEEYFNYYYYTGSSTGHSPFDLTHWTGSEGYICPSDVVYAMPKRAQNVQGYWRVIVNDAHYHTQTARLETCLFPEAACRALAPCWNSACTQKFVYHRLLSFDPCDPYKGLFIDIYKFPSACSCHIPVY